jgi:non-specific serine/threonine protein kinase
MGGSSSSRRRRRLWRFAGSEFDEASWTLRVAGHPVSLEAKPLEVLHELLLRAGEVVTKDEILDAVWPGINVVEGSLPTAISKLRKALGDGEASVIATVPRIGYRLVAEVSIDSIDAPLAPRFEFAAGDPVPGRNQWRLDEALGDTGANDVWTARHAKIGDVRVFKFADAPDRLRALKREAALARVLAAGLGEQAPMPALLEWNFEHSPYFLEYAHGGVDLLRWAEVSGGLGAIALERRIAIACDIARAVAAVHGIGVLHKDLKPANILVEKVGDADRVRLADFGSGRLIERTVFDTFGITDPGSLEAELAGEESRSGTAAYRAPELVGDAMPTIASDIYALGLILLQLVVGDFAATLAPGWERRVDDPLLRDDIARAAAGNPADRFASAAELADRLEALETRRRAASDAATVAARNEALRADAARAAARRPWVQAAFATLAVGLLVSGGLAAYAWTQRNEAVAARDLAETSYAFLAEDILSSPDPVRSNAEESVMAAMKRASASIDQRYASAPATAARLHLAVARAFHQRGDMETARTAYANAERQFARAGETQGDDAVIGRLGLAHLEANSGQPERLELAGKIVARERERLGQRADSGRVGYWLALSEGAYHFFGDIEQAERAFRRSVALGSTPEAGISQGQLLKSRSSLLITMMRLGKFKEAEPVARDILAASILVRGARHPDTLVAQQHLITNMSFLGRHEEALRRSAPLLKATEDVFGPDHRFALTLRSTRFESFSALGRFEEAAAESLRVWQGASAQAGPESHQAIVGQNDYGAALCQTARKGEALGILRQASERVEAAFPAEYPLVHVVRYYLAECQLANRRFAEAERLMKAIDRKGAITLLGRPEFDAEVDLGLADAALGQGRREEASRLLTKAQNGLADSDDAVIKRRLASLRAALG